VRVSRFLFFSNFFFRLFFRALGPLRGPAWRQPAHVATLRAPPLKPLDINATRVLHACFFRKKTPPLAHKPGMGIRPPAVRVERACQVSAQGRDPANDTRPTREPVEGPEIRCHSASGTTCLQSSKHARKQPELRTAAVAERPATVAASHPEAMPRPANSNAETTTDSQTPHHGQNTRRTQQQQLSAAADRPARVATSQPEDKAEASEQQPSRQTTDSSQTPHHGQNTYTAAAAAAAPRDYLPASKQAARAKSAADRPARVATSQPEDYAKASEQQQPSRQTTDSQTPHHGRIRTRRAACCTRHRATRDTRHTTPNQLDSFSGQKFFFPVLHTAQVVKRRRPGYVVEPRTHAHIEVSLRPYCGNIERRAETPARRPAPAQHGRATPPITTLLPR